MTQMDKIVKMMFSPLGHNFTLAVELLYNLNLFDIDEIHKSIYKLAPDDDLGISFSDFVMRVNKKRNEYRTALVNEALTAIDDKLKSFGIVHIEMHEPNEFEDEIEVYSIKLTNVNFTLYYKWDLTGNIDDIDTIIINCEMSNLSREAVINIYNCKEVLNDILNIQLLNKNKSQFISKIRDFKSLIPERESLHFADESRIVAFDWAISQNKYPITIDPLSIFWSGIQTVYKVSQILAHDSDNNTFTCKLKITDESKDSKIIHLSEDELRSKLYLEEYSHFKSFLKSKYIFPKET